MLRKNPVAPGDICGFSRIPGQGDQVPQDAAGGLAYQIDFIGAHELGPSPMNQYEPQQLEVALRIKWPQKVDSVEMLRDRTALAVENRQRSRSQNRNLHSTEDAEVLMDDRLEPIQ